MTRYRPTQLRPGAYSWHPILKCLQHVVYRAVYIDCVVCLNVDLNVYLNVALTTRHTLLIRTINSVMMVLS